MLLYGLPHSTFLFLLFFFTSIVVAQHDH